MRGEAGEKIRPLPLIAFGIELSAPEKWGELCVSFMKGHVLQSHDHEM